MACSELGALLCAEEVGAALGAQVRPSTCLLPPPSSDAVRICLWRSAGGRGWLALTAFTGPLACNAVRLARRGGEPVPGLGDEAWMRAGLVCVVRCDRRVLKLVLSGSRMGDPSAALLRLAHLACRRLDQPAATPPIAPGPPP
jgi:hypothetical protein